MKKIKIQAKVAPKVLKEVYITTEFIRLDAALKLASVVSTQRGKKLRDGDTFSFGNRNFIVKKEN